MSWLTVAQHRLDSDVTRQISTIQRDGSLLLDLGTKLLDCDKSKRYEVCNLIPFYTLYSMALARLDGTNIWLMPLTSSILSVVSLFMELSSAADEFVPIQSFPETTSSKT